MPELVALPGFASGMRYVAPPAYIQARPVADASLAPSQYVTLYLVEEPVQQAFDNLHRRSQELHTLGRQRANRQTYLIGSCLLVKASAAPRVLVTPEAVPFRPHRGVLVAVADILDRRKYEAVAQWLDRVHIPDVLQVPGVAGVYWFESPPDASGRACKRTCRRAGRSTSGTWTATRWRRCARCSLAARRGSNRAG